MTVGGVGGGGGFMDVIDQKRFTIFSTAMVQYQDIQMNLRILKIEKYPKCIEEILF